MKTAFLTLFLLFSTALMGQNSLTPWDSIGFCRVVPSYYDTIPVVMLVSDTAHFSEWEYFIKYDERLDSLSGFYLYRGSIDSAFVDRGQRNKTVFWVNGFIVQPGKKYGIYINNEIFYLDEKKKLLPGTYVVWQTQNRKK
ncbi:MAG: hypothetical protein M0P47_09415 [Bacteroidales bacterium]|nr:hypothetical protein [Bacteroidales bacterium]